MEALRQIRAIGIDRLAGHPANPNRMSKAAFGKLKSHIERTGNYEPVVVRRHRGRAGCFEIINGRHRVEALRELGYVSADCVVWDVDDDEVLVLSGTLNRLGGRDDLGKKSELIKGLCERFDVRQLAAKLPDSARTIERLRDLQKQPPATVKKAKAFLNPVMFFLTDDQKRTVDAVLAEAVKSNAGETMAQKKARAFASICRNYLEKQETCI